MPPVSSDYLDERGRLLPGSVPGWGASYWFHENGLIARDMTPSERLGAMCRYFRAVDAGWEPPVPREEWVGPHHPSDPEPTPQRDASPLEDRGGWAC
jgi:hypothetical protein